MKILYLFLGAISAGIIIYSVNICSLGICIDEHGNPEAEENFEEAMKAVTSNIKPTVVPSHVRDILDDDSCINLTSKVQVMVPL
jgi:hypothetical protein